MKILIITKFVDSAGGISGQVALLKKHLQEEGHTTDIFNTKGNIAKRIAYFHELHKVAQVYDVLHIHCCSYFGFYPAILGVEVGRRLGKRIVCTYHGGGAEHFFSRFTWLVRHYLKRTDANIVLSGFLARVFNQCRLPYTVIPNMLEQKTTASISDIQRTEVRPRFISVRTLEPIYNIECILRAFAIVRQHIPQATLDVLSDGSCRPRLEQYVAKNGIGGVTFVGRVANNEIDTYLQRNDIFISMPHVDNQPMSVLEAWRNGLLVISSNVGGVPYMVEDGKTGILVESDNELQLAYKMSEAVEKPDKTLAIMKNGNAHLACYSWERIREQILKTYKA